MTGYSQHLRDSCQAGIEAGWDAANYAEAYGIDPKEGGKEKQAATRATEQASYDSGEFLNGFREGWDLFDAGCYQDGLPMDDEERERDGWDD